MFGWLDKLGGTYYGQEQDVGSASGGMGGGMQSMEGMGGNYEGMGAENSQSNGGGFMDGLMSGGGIPGANGTVPGGKFANAGLASYKDMSGFGNMGSLMGSVGGMQNLGQKALQPQQRPSQEQQYQDPYLQSLMRF